MIDKQNNEKEKVMSKIVVRVEKSGNRFNAFDVDNVKYTSQITTILLITFSFSLFCLSIILYNTNSFA